MFSWIIQWADDKYRQLDESLNSVAKNFLCLLIGEKDSSFIHSVSVGRQWENIDIWVEVNDDIFIVIEDKVNTNSHDGQLKRYKETVEDWYKGKRDKLFYSYVKTGNESKATLIDVESTGYRYICRKEIISCLSNYSGNNDIVIDYRKHLLQIERETQSWRQLPVSEWCGLAWEGFYKELEKHLTIKGWGYVPNASGGFMGAWWHMVKTSDVEMYLQFEESKLCFKIYYEDEDRTSVREKYYRYLMELAKDRYPEIVKPYRFGCGYYMTIAIVEPVNLFGSSIVNVDLVVGKLNEYQKIVDECCK
ncbi:MAG: hypothetical protein AUK63_658 [bacterium P3]|nr:MAG: hypothetical protein AUK63_658 [bacterium P3]KWW42141.1 MAG: hypothetical protein F083_480 [bacterium F083]